VICIELKINLYFLFGPFGEILEIVTRKKNSLRGQAFIIFSTTVGATQAMKALQGFVFFEKPLVSGDLLIQTLSRKYNSPRKSRM